MSRPLSLSPAVLVLGLVLAGCSGGAADGGGGGGAGDGGSGGGSGGSGGGSGGTGGFGGSPAIDAVVRAVTEARATAIPACTVYVDAANAGVEDGTDQNPWQTLNAAVTAAADGAVICVAEGTYAEALAPGTKYFTLAGGFQSGNYTVRDSAQYVTRAEGDGSNIFLFYEDPGPTSGQLTAVDGFEITGYSQGIVRAIYFSQDFDVTNNYIHDNTCVPNTLVGGAISFDNISGTISGNVLANNECGRGAAAAITDSTNENTVVVTRNLVDSNDGVEPDIGHGGGLYLFGSDLTVTSNEIVGNTVTGWGGGLYIGAVSGGGQVTLATIRWNVIRDNTAAIFGGGFFCDDSAVCLVRHDLYVGNCGGNIFLDSGDTAPTIASFEYITNVNALTPDCLAEGAGVQIYNANTEANTYSFRNAIFWGNAPGHDFETGCEAGCSLMDVTVDYSMVDTDYGDTAVDVTFGDGILAPVDPLFVDEAGGDFHLRSTAGHWTASGPVADAEDSPALAAGDPASSPSGEPLELGTYGSSEEASLVP